MRCVLRSGKYRIRWQLNVHLDIKLLCIIIIIQGENFLSNKRHSFSLSTMFYSRY